MKKLPKVESTWEQHYQKMLDKKEYRFFVYHILEVANADGSVIVYEAPKNVSWKKWSYKSIKMEDVLFVAFPNIMEFTEAASELECNNGDKLGVVFYFKRKNGKRYQIKCFVAGFPDEENFPYANVVTKKNMPKVWCGREDKPLDAIQMEIVLRHLKQEFKRNKKYVDEGAE